FVSLKISSPYLIDSVIESSGSKSSKEGGICASAPSSFCSVCSSWAAVQPTITNKEVIAAIQSLFCFNTLFPSSIFLLHFHYSSVKILILREKRVLEAFSKTVQTLDENL